ncbi:MAG: NYN domain-containing protein [Candidatus Heimdallarchaeota archaeon]|nr:NYN domain-containing protein [Candidatus Heimdallarchaeota archaeon]
MSRMDIKEILGKVDEISEKMSQLIKGNQLEENIAVLWDVENVNPGTDSLFIEGFLEFINKFGRLTVAQAFADWNRRHLKKLANLLSERRFELIHVPRARKNSSDISLVTHGMELALQYHNLQTFILLTGDADFRPLILSLRRSGKKIHIVCDVQNASESLLILADSFIDYRELRPGGSTEKDIEEEDQLEEKKEKTIEKEEKAIAKSKRSKLKERREIAFDLLVEAIKRMKDDKLKPGFGLVKVRLSMLNPNFNEKKLGYSSWSDFVNAAINARRIKVEGKRGEEILDIIPSEKTKEMSEQEKAFNILLKILERLDKNKEPKYHNFANVAEELYKEPNFNELKEKLGYKQFKEFIQAAEVRKLVETEVEGLVYRVKRI